MGASRLGPVAIGIVIALLAGIAAVGLVVERRGVRKPARCWSLVP